ncbi:MAG TPA: PA0069 family radical SAM protein [Phycisphaerae bacterium]
MRRVDNPPNPYIGIEHEWLEPPPAATVEVYEETAKSVITENESPDVPFRWSVNPYRGCQHACAYCYARPYHEYLGFGAGTDFETKLVVKVNAAELLDRELRNPKWAGESLTFSGITDCYQPLEAVYRITQACLRVCLDHRNPVAIITKSYLVMRDADLLAELNRTAGAKVFQSIPFSDDALARLIEPQAPPPSRRFDAMRKLSQAGVPVGVMVAPIIPGLNDQEIGQVVQRAAEAGACSAGYVPLRLAGSVRPVFLTRLREVLPDRAARVEARIRDMRGGRLNDSRFHTRMRGEGPYWHSIQELFRVCLQRYGLGAVERPDPETAAAVRPKSADGQLSLFPAGPI